MPQEVRAWLRAVVALGLITTLTSCAIREPASHRYNPLGWPAHGLTSVGRAGAKTGWPVLRELGRFVAAVGEVADTPALFVKGIATLTPGRFADSGRTLVEGTGATVTATWNVPFFWVPGRSVDLGRDVELVNDALAHLEQTPPENFRTDGDDERPFVFPPGTRAHAEGDALVYTIPGRGEVIQVAEENFLWHGLQSLFGMNFPAQERSWGFVVRTRGDWNSIPDQHRAGTILHELYHQQMQMREVFLGWTTVYWPAYNVTFPFTGWYGHWAEMESSICAGAVDRGLSGWEPAR